MSVSVGLLVVFVVVQAVCTVAVALAFYYLGKQAAEIQAQRERDEAMDRVLDALVGEV